MEFNDKMKLLQGMIDDIHYRARELTSYEQGYMQCIEDINHYDQISSEHIVFLQKLYKRLYQPKT